MYVEIWQELVRSTVVPNGLGRDVKLKRKTNDDTVEVGLAHSSLRAGKPFTWRRG